MKKLNPELLVGRRQRRPNGAGMRASAVQRQHNGDGGQREDTSLRTQNQLVEHDPNDEEQRVQQLDRRVKLHLLFEEEGSFYRLKEMRKFAACELLKPFALLTHAGDQLFFRQSCQHPKRVNAP